MSRKSAVNIFEEIDYRKTISKLVMEKKQLDSRVNFQRLAEAMRVQKSYLSNVLKGRAELSSDQLFLASEYLALDSEQRHYLTLLLEYGRSGLQIRKAGLLEEIKAIQKNKRESKAHLKAEKISPMSEDLTMYYLDPMNQLIHVALTIKRYQRDLSLLAHDLEIKTVRVQRIVTFLEKMGILERHPGKPIRLNLEHIHLPRENAIFPAWRNQLRQLSLGRLLKLDSDEAYSFSVTFSANEDTFELVRGKFLKLLREIEGPVGQASAEGLYHLAFDLFPWV